MADFLCKGFQVMRASQMASDPADMLYYFATLHDATNPAGVITGLATTDTVYSSGMGGELATGGGYTRGTKPAGSVTASTNQLSIPQIQWTQDGSGTAIGPASYCVIWCNTSNSITGAHAIAVKDSSAASSLTPQSASGGGTLTLAASTLTMA